MDPTSSQLRYDAVAQALHWLIALAIIGLLAVGWLMTSMDNSPEKFTLFQLHKSFGITVLLLAVFRLGWRFFHRPPPLPPGMPSWERAGAHLSHVCLYGLMIGMPFVGWIMVSASPLNLPTVLFGVIPWPHLPFLPDLANKEWISHKAGRLHGLLAWVIVGFAVVHALAALKHHFYDRDEVLTRMTPRFLVGAFNRLRGSK